MGKDGFRNIGCNWEYRETTYAHYLQLSLITTLPPNNEIRESTNTLFPTINYAAEITAFGDAAGVSTAGVQRNDPRPGTATCLILVSSLRSISTRSAVFARAVSRHAARRCLICMDTPITTRHHPAPRCDLHGHASPQTPPLLPPSGQRPLAARRSVPRSSRARPDPSQRMDSDPKGSRSSKGRKQDAV